MSRALYFQGNHALKNLNLSQNLLIDMDPMVSLFFQSNFAFGIEKLGTFVLGLPR